MRVGSALLVGMGGLGCPASLALAWSGVRRLTLVDPDRVDVSNLHRQPWYRHDDVGRAKVEVAAERLRAAFPKLEVCSIQAAVDSQNAEALFRAADFVVDGADRIETKFLLSDCAVLTGVRLVYGGVIQLQGQAMVIRPEGPCLRCLFEEVPPADSVPSCAEAGVLGSMAGVLGGLQVMLGLGAPEAEEPGFASLHRLDGRTLRGHTLRVSKALDCSACSPGARVQLRLVEEVHVCRR